MENVVEENEIEMPKSYEYIIVENDIIKGHYCGEELPEGAIEVENFKGRIGENINAYNDQWGKKTDSELYKSGLLSSEEYSAIKRAERDSLLSATDKYLLPDFPIDEERLSEIKLYRQTLRDLPEQKGFPDLEIPKLQ